MKFPTFSEIIDLTPLVIQSSNMSTKQKLTKDPNTLCDKTVKALRKPKTRFEEVLKTIVRTFRNTYQCHFK
jgi:hypothetical protein